MTDGVTEKASESQLLDFGLSTKVCIMVNPYTVQLKCDGEDDSNVIEIFWRYASKKNF